MNVLPKAIRSSIGHYLFLPIVQNVNLFRGVSKDLLFQLVPEMEAEYYPSKEDVILQNESQTYFYIIVSGALDLLVDIDGREQIIGKAVARESFGEIGVLLGRPRPYAVTTTEISQILCVSRKTFLNILRHNQEEEQIIMRNHFQQEMPTNPSDLISINIQTLEARTMKQVENESESGGGEHHIVLDHYVVPKGHIEMATSLPERRWKEDQLDTERGGNKSIHEVPCCSYSGNRSQTSAIGGKSIKKRVTIHMRNNINSLQEQNVKLIILPDTLEELFIVVTTRRTENDS
ncbi:potassium channel KAT1-like [Solanum verrucosum]|uniref:potassium channel KAT1-like n=1 Tax=Solanum verrucosum TaxID=315347 RepID=UPI0020D17AB1|nr:potassium channel KAT1-like [Solanum verrucosum]